jgi:hypothetical protein
MKLSTQWALTMGRVIWRLFYCDIRKLKLVEHQAFLPSYYLAHPLSTVNSCFSFSFFYKIATLPQTKTSEGRGPETDNPGRRP